jgi:DNA polymerase III alpha subunit (gram-positive type)
MKSYVWDIETNGLLDVLDKIHVAAWQEVGTNEVHHTHDYDEMRDFINKADVLIAHNQIRFDTPAVKKVLGIKVKARLIDTLALSWYLNPDRIKHGLESYGIEYGVPKPVVTDWNNLTPEDYAHRCCEDVKINSRLWRDLSLKLRKLYP